METGRKLILAISIIVIGFIGWIGWISFFSSAPLQMSESVLNNDEMTTLEHDLQDYIMSSTDKEKKGIKVLSLAVASPINQGDQVEVPYTLKFKEPKSSSVSMLQATAYLKHVGSKYRIVKVVPQKEEITYDASSSTIIPDSKPEGSETK